MNKILLKINDPEEIRHNIVYLHQQKTRADHRYNVILINNVWRKSTHI